MDQLLTDRLAEIITDPRTVLVLLLGLWLPVLIIVMAVLAAFVYLGGLAIADAKQE
jgi:hypothetical protein